VPVLRLEILQSVLTCNSDALSLCQMAPCHLGVSFPIGQFKKEQIMDYASALNVAISSAVSSKSKMSKSSAKCPLFLLCVVKDDPV
jgi:hypothetical protein